MRRLFDISGDWRSEKIFRRQEAGVEVGNEMWREDESNGMVSGLQSWADCGSTYWDSNCRRRGILERKKITLFQTF